MAMLPGVASDGQLLGNAIAALQQHRNSLIVCANLYAWVSAYTPADLETLGLDSTTAQAILSALADANAEYQMYNTGLPPSTYPQPPEAYTYGASQRALIGPQ